jgi:hypothetical protein
MQFCNEIEFIKLLINATKKYCNVNVIKIFWHILKQNDTFVK